ncbi:MAG: hypothetical protein OXU50_03260, partial [Gammaproteobacteria bacterium]|nr:hypothetical protein [Gammaproteobacteria bacterium]
MTSATAGDFAGLPALPLSGTATFAAGASTWRMDLSVARDREIEPDLRGFQFAISTAGITGAFGEVGVTGTVITAAIESDPVPFIQPSVVPRTVVEGAVATPTMAFVLVGENGPVVSGVPVMVDYRLSGDADYGDDYRIRHGGDITFNAGTRGGTMTFPPGQGRLSIEFEPVDDTRVENTENVILELSNARPRTEAALSPSSTDNRASFDITDDERIAVVAKAREASVLEPANSGDGPAGNGRREVMFDIALSGGTLDTGDSLTVDYMLEGTATPGADYLCTDPASNPCGTGTVTFGAGDTTQSITLAVVWDNFADLREDIFVTLTGFSASAGAIFLDNSARTATTIRPDTGDILRVEPISVAVTEAATDVLVRLMPIAAGADPAAIPANLNATATVTWTLGAGTAVWGVNHGRPHNYRSRVGTITVPAGWPGTGEEIGAVIPLLQDGYNRVTVTVVVMLTGVNAPGSDLRLTDDRQRHSATLSIRDSDPVIVSLGPVNPSLVNERGTFPPRAGLKGTDTAHFDILLTGGIPTEAVVVDYRFTGGITAADFADQRLTHTATIPASSRSARRSFTARRDDVSEPDETVTVELTAARTAADTQLATTASRMSATIHGNGLVYGVRGGTSANLPEEGGSAEVVLYHSPGRGADFDAPYRIIPFAGVNGGATTADYTVRHPAGAAGPGQGDGSNEYGLISRGVLNRNDFRARQPGFFGFDVGMRITATPDVDVEGHERFRIEFGAPFNVAPRLRGITPASAVGDRYANRYSFTILEDDHATLSIEADGEWTEGGDSMTVHFVVRGGRIRQDFQGDYSVSGCTFTCQARPAASGDVRIVNNGTESYDGAYVSSWSVALLSRAQENNLNQADHATARIRWTPDMDSLPPAVAEFVTIANDRLNVVLRDNDDITVDLAISTGRYWTLWGGTATFIATLNGAADGSAGVITLPYEFSGAGGAVAEDLTAGADAGTPGRGNLVIQPGDTTGAVVLRLDARAMGTESVRVSLGEPQVSAAGGRVALGDADLTVLASPSTPSFYTIEAGTTPDRDAAAAGVQVHEGDTATFIVALGGEGFGGVTSVTWTVGGEVEASDYDVASGTLTFTAANWQTPQTVRIGITDETLNEATETLTLMLGDVFGGGGAAGILTATAEVSVAQNDPITYRVENTFAAEGTTAPVAVRLSAPSAGDVTVPVSIVGGGTAKVRLPAPRAEYIPDYDAPPPAMITVPAFAITASAPVVAIADDNWNEYVETIRVVLGEAVVSSRGGVATFAAGGAGTVSIVDDDAAVARIEIGRGNPRQPEGHIPFFPVTVDTQSVDFVAVPFTIMGTVDADDYDIAQPRNLGPSATGGEFRFYGRDDRFFSYRTRSIMVRINNDPYTEDEETLIIVLGTPRAAGPGRFTNSSATIIIPASDPLSVSVAPDAPTVAEGATASFTVSLRGGIPTAPVFVPFAVSGTAAVVDDYNIAQPADLGAQATTGTLVIAARETAGQIALAVHSDNIAEEAETLVIELGTPRTAIGSASLAPPGAMGMADRAVTIAASVRQPLVSLSAPFGTGVEGTSQTWRVSLDRAHTKDVEVSYRISAAAEGDSASADDFERVQGAAVTALPFAGTVRVAAGATQASIVLLYTDDDGSGGAGEPEEYFQISLTGFGGDPEPGVLFAATLDTDGPQVSRGSIASIARSMAGVASHRVSAPEGANAVFSIVLDAPHAEATTVHWTLGGTALRGVDYGGA